MLTSTASENTEVFVPVDKVFIPADGECLYTSIFLGYLLPVVQDALQFKNRLAVLIGHDLGDNTELFRQDLLKNFRVINFLRFTVFKDLISSFKQNMSIESKLWGGDNEIKLLSKRLNITIQELIDSDPNKVEAEKTYIVSDKNEPPNDIASLETIYILRTMPNDIESVNQSEDLMTQVAQSASSLSNHHLQHYRLVTNKAIDDSQDIDFGKLEDIDLEKPENNLTADNLNNVRSFQTIGAASNIIQTFQNLFNPPKDKFPDNLEITPNSMEQGLELITGNRIPPSLLSRAPDFIDESSPGQPNMKFSDYQTMTELMIRTGMQERPQYFTPIENNEPISEDASIAIGINFMKEFIQAGPLNIWLSNVRKKIQEDKENDPRQAVYLEVVEGFSDFMNYLMSDDVKDPYRNRLNKYVDPVELERAIELQDWLSNENNREHPAYESLHCEFNKVDQSILSQRGRAIREFGEYIFSLSKRLDPQLAEMETMDAILQHQKSKRQSDERKAFEAYVLQEYGKQKDIFEPNQLRGFMLKLQSQQYGKIFYKMICESFTEEYKTNPVHKILQQIWSAFHLDTIHYQPKEARTRMPVTSVDGLETSNFGYAMGSAPAYQKWITNPLARANGDIIMDAFHFIVDFGRELNIDTFINRLKMDLSETKEEKMDFFINSHKYDDFITPFEHYLLERVFNTPYSFDIKKPLSVALLQAAESKENLLNAAQQALYALKEFSCQMFALRPSEAELSEQDKRRGLVFGIGFNGKMFDSPSHTQYDNPEIWLSFSDSGRTPGGYVLLFLMTYIVQRPFDKFHEILNAKFASGFEFDRYRLLIRQHVENEKRIFGKPDKDWRINNDRYTDVKQERKKFARFTTQLEENISFSELELEFKDWISDTQNWYLIPHGVKVQIADEMLPEEYEVQKLARRLLFDALVQRPFSIEYPSLMALLFLHWKDEILDILKKDMPLAVPIIEKSSTLEKVPKEFSDTVVKVIDQLVWKVDANLKSIWEKGQYGITEFFQKFMAEK